MSLHTLRLVDSIAASPTTRLDLNDGVTWTCTSFEAPPPRLRRSVSANAMRDGINVSSASYDARTLKATLRVQKTTIEEAATQQQVLARELDRYAGNYLMYQPNTLTKPVFFVTYRSDFTDLRPALGESNVFECGVEWLAEPFALGLRETLGPYTVNNDPAAGSNGCYVDVTGVIGDVPAQCVIKNTSAWRTYGLLAMRQHGTPSDMVRFKQAESVTLGTDTTNPGGGPDAAMSGTGTNNYVRTSFATGTLVPRLTWSTSSDITTAAQATAMRGTFRVLVALRRSGVTSTITARATVDWGGGYNLPLDIVTVPNVTTRAIVDLGVVDMSPTPVRFPYGVSDAPATPADWPNLAISASRTGGSDTLDWDCIILVPADEQTLSWGIDESQDTALDTLVDGVQDDIYSISGDPFAGGTMGISRHRPAIQGSWPQLVPNQTNRLFVFMGASVFTSPVTDTNALTVSYWPRYLHVRPSAT